MSVSRGLLRRMRILFLLSAYAPHRYGGGEVSATNLMRWLAAHGHEVSVFTMAGKDDHEIRGAEDAGISVWRLRNRHPYAFWEHHFAPRWKKPLWYLLDHADPLNRRLMSEVLEQVRPDLVAIHVVSGLGYNTFYEIAKRDIPAIYFMHDLSLICTFGGFARHEQVCKSRCLHCRAVSFARLTALRRIPRLGICSPSRAIMAKVRETTRLDDARCRVILNANAHPQPTIQHTASDFVRFLYFGRLHVSKGVAILLEALAGLADQFRFSVKVAGTGPEEERLRKAYANAHWCTFLGYRSQEVISDLIADSDLLCAPSIGWENSPGVVIHALSQGLPVMASDAGGLSELLVDNQNGRLVPPGDVVAWRRALQSVLLDPDQLAQWRAGAQAGSSRFDQDALGEQIYQFMLDTIGAASWR